MGQAAFPTRHVENSESQCRVDGLPRPSGKNLDRVGVVSISMSNRQACSLQGMCRIVSAKVRSMAVHNIPLRDTSAWEIASLRSQ